ncbi:MAG TPA: DUF4625 domain-containing protein [Saprospiraceae bacterium]|nr:DUF4625 domain-containing protein [Saprospiraceae bacterium]
MVRIFIFSFLLLIGINSCTPGELDLTAPTLIFLSMIPSPEPGLVCGVMEDKVIVITGGETLQFEVLLEDDQALSQYKIDIHNNFDCHGHGDGASPGISIPNTGGNTADWSLLEINNISGKEVVVNKNLKVPDHVTAGLYHFQVQVIDEAGNDDPFSNFLSIRVFHPEDKIAPYIHAELPHATNEYKKGEKVRFKGRLTDNRPFNLGGNSVLYLTYTDLNTQNTFITSQVFILHDVADTLYEFDFEYTVPLTLVNGNYRFSLRAHDGVRNVAEVLHFQATVSN